MLHFGRSPRYNPNVKVIQIDLCAEELHNSVKAAVSIQSDLKPAIKSITEDLYKKRFNFSKDRAWWKLLNKKCEENKASVKVSKFTCMKIYLNENNCELCATCLTLYTAHGHNLTVVMKIIVFVFFIENGDGHLSTSKLLHGLSSPATGTSSKLSDCE